MKLTLIISLLCLSSCTWLSIGTPESSQAELQQLRQENTALQTENATLREENTLLKAGGDPSTLQSSFGSSDTTYTEGSYDSCMQDAHAGYISAGTDYCKKSGYSTGDILANKCQLDNSVIHELQMTESGAQSECHNLYK
jgi:hypothetical protein